MRRDNGLSRLLSYLLGQLRQRQTRFMLMLFMMIAAGFLLSYSLIEARRSDTNQATIDESSLARMVLAPAATTITVNDSGDSTPANDGKCTLREAITAANMNTASGAATGECAAGAAGADVIVFSIGAGTPAINLTSQLPIITEPVTIKGNSGGATSVELNGTSAGAGAHGLRISAGNSTIQRLVINRFSGNGILITGTGANTIKGCFIGTSANGLAAQGNNNGIEILGSSNNTVGGTADGDRNIISGNTSAGIRIAYDTPNSLAAAGNKVFGNFIGTDFNGKSDLGNGGIGLDIAGGSTSTVGGVTPETRNIISGNNGGGVKISTANATSNVIIGNYIGVDIGALTPLGNTGAGVLIDGASNNRVGGLGVPCPGNNSSTCSEGNTIKFNSQKGVVVKTAQATGNSILGNIISQNSGAGIDLGDDGLTPHTVPGAPTGVSATAGNAQATVSFTPPASDGGSVIFAYTVTSSPGGITKTGASSPLTVTGLTNNTPYTFTVTATNFIGTSAPSSASNQVTPSSSSLTASNSSAPSEVLALPDSTGPNNFQNFPVLTGVTVGSNSSTINGFLRSYASTTFRIEFFLNPLCDPSGNGEGQIYIGSADVTTNPLVFNDPNSGVAIISKSLDYPLPGGLSVTATATRLSAGTPIETSEFSACAAIPYPDGDCHVVAFPGATSFSASAASTTFEVNGRALCGWTATSMVDWVTIGSGAAGIGNGAVVFNIAANTGAFRFGTVKVAGTDYTISQDGACAATISPMLKNFPAQASTGTISLFTPSACSWSITNINPWVTVTTQASGSGSTYIDISVDANTGASQRIGIITIAGQSFIVSQDAPCTANINPTSKTFTTAAGGGSFDLTVGPTCPWTVEVSDPWISVTSATSGSGNATVTYTITANTGGQRSGNISVAGKTFVISQDPACPVTIDPTNANIGAAGGSGSVNVTTGPSCSWQATTETLWIHITSGANGTGNGTVNYTVDANSGAARSGQITVAGQTFLVQQSALCSFMLSPVSNTIVAVGGTGTANVTTTASCQWTALPSDPWISITSGASGTGNGTINYSVTTNGSGSQRVGSIMVGDQTLVITQEGGCTYNVSPTSQSFAAAGGSNTVNVTAAVNCGWLASSNDAWITVTSSLQSPKNNAVLRLATPSRQAGKNSIAGTGNGTVSYSVAVNTGPARTGTMFVAGTLVTITQASGCPINITPANLTSTQLGANYSQQLSQTGGTGNITWTVSNGSLPPGIQLNSSSGLLSGTPSLAGDFSFAVRATDAGGCYGEIPYMLTVTCQGLTITPASLNAGVVGSAYNQQLTLTGGSGTILWSVNVGALPLGMTLDSATGLLSGAPQAQGTFNITVRATVIANGCFTDKSYTLTINCPTITVDQATIIPGNLGVSYSQQFTQTGATGNVTWTLSSGSLPNNLTLSTSGLLSGTPVASGSFPITVRATSGNNCFGEKSYVLLIGTCPAITILPATLSNGLINTNYNQVLTASGGSGGYTFTFTGNLPNGVTLSSGGTLSGAPTVVGSFSFTVTATDQSGCTGTKSYTLVICSPITVNPATLPNGTVGSAYSQNLSAVGGGIPHNFTFSGTLPNGVTLANDGVLSGVPSVPGTFNFTVTATDTSSCTGSQSYTVTINPAGLMFYPLPRPLRILDTRAGGTACDTPGQQIPGGTSRLQTAAGRTCDSISIPASAKALTGNVTTVQSGGGFLTLYPSDATRPMVANSNYQANQVLNNVFTVGLGAGDGAFNIYVTSNTDVVIDITGYYAPAGPGGLYFHPLPSPVRILETRSGHPGCDTPGTPIAGGIERTQQGRIFCNGVTIPSSAAAIVGNATAVTPGGQGFLTLYPGNAPTRPLAANSNYAAGQNMNAPFTVGLAPDGTFKIYSSQTTNLVVDVLGYYSPDAVDLNGTGLLFTPLPRPVRLLETRMGQPGCDTPGAPLDALSTRIQQARGTCDGMTVAATAQAIVGNATAVFPASNGFLTFWPSDGTQPGTANSNYQAGKVFNRHITVGLGADGAFKIFTSATTDLVIDVSGYFAP